MVDETNRQIQDDIERLYERLRKQETKTMLKRLVKVPEDIANVVTLLLARDLDECDFDLLKKAFDSVADEDGNKIQYAFVFFRHFAGKAIKEPELRNFFIGEFEELILSAFKNDITKSIKDMVQELVIMPDNVKMQVIRPYYNALKASKYKHLDTLYDDLKSVVINEQWQEIVSDKEEEVEEDK